MKDKEQKEENEKMKEIKRIDSIEEIFEDKIGSLDNFIQRIGLNDEKGLKNFLLKGNVSLNQVEISPIQDLEDLPKNKEEKKEEKVEYKIKNEDKGKYENITKDENIIPSDKIILSPGDFLKNHKRIYSSQNPIKDLTNTSKNEQDFAKATMLKISDLNKEMKEKYQQNDYDVII